MNGELLTDPPARLAELVRLAGDRPVSQPVIKLDPARWVEAAPTFEPEIRSLPSDLDRASVRAFCREQTVDESGLVASFIASQVWGYGRVGYGPHRLSAALADPDLGAALGAAREALEMGDPVSAFRRLCVESRLPWLGTAFGTKYLYFADPHGDALILDSLVAKWLRANTGRRFDCNRREGDYALWLDLASAWAEDLGIESEQVELLVFSDALPENSQWRPGESSEPDRGRERIGVEFRIGEAFPPDLRLARWITGCVMAQNDLFLVNRWLVPRLEGTTDSEGYEHLYLARLAASHLFEVANFLRRGDRFPDIREFVAGLDADDQAAYGSLLAIAKGETGEFAEQVEHLRNNFSHYGDLLPDQDAAHEDLRKAMQAHADDGTVGRIRDQTPPITGFRAMFADDIAAELAFPGDDKEATEKFVEQISVHVALFLRFMRGVLASYASRTPEGAWNAWHEDAPPQEG